jgi:hypothetical protein
MNSQDIHQEKPYAAFTPKESSGTNLGIMKLVFNLKNLTKKAVTCALLYGRLQSRKARLAGLAQAANISRLRPSAQNGRRLV